MAQLEGRWIKDGTIVPSKIDTSSAFTFHDVNVTVDSSVTGNCYVGGDLLVAGSFNHGGGDSTINGSFRITGNSYIDGSLTVANDYVLGGDSLVIGDSTVIGDSSVYGNFRVEGDVSLMGNSYVGGTARVVGNSIVDGNLLVHGNSTVDFDSTVSGDLTVFGKTYLKNDTTVDGTLAVEGIGGVYGSGRIITNNISTTQNVESYPVDLYIYSGVISNPLVRVGPGNGLYTRMSIEDGVQFEAQDISTFNDVVTVNSDATVTGNVYLDTIRPNSTDTVTMDSTVTVIGDFTIEGPAAGDKFARIEGANNTSVIGYNVVSAYGTEFSMRQNGVSVPGQVAGILKQDLSEIYTTADHHLLIHTAYGGADSTIYITPDSANKGVAPDYLPPTLAVTPSSIVVGGAVAVTGDTSCNKIVPYSGKSIQINHGSSDGTNNIYGRTFIYSDPGGTAIYGGAESVSLYSNDSVKIYSDATVTGKFTPFSGISMVGENPIYWKTVPIHSADYVGYLQSYWVPIDVTTSHTFMGGWVTRSTPVGSSPFSRYIQIVNNVTLPTEVNSLGVVRTPTDSTWTLLLSSTTNLDPTDSSDMRAFMFFLKP